MSIAMSPKSIWWKEPMVWLIIGLPLAAVIGGFTTLWLAVKNADSLVADDYYKQGMAVHLSRDKDARAAALGLKADIQVRGGILSVRLSGRLDRFPDRLDLTLVHLAHAEQDRIINLSAIAPGEYQGVLPTMSAGLRQLILEPKQQDWRLSGRGNVPFTALTRLAATIQDSSTHP